MGVELLGKKIGMTQLFDAHGNFVPVTVVEAGPCRVLQKKTAATDGYQGYQVGFVELKPKHATKPQVGHCQKAGAPPMRFIREFRADDSVQLNVGDQVTVKEFRPGDYVDVIGTSKGKGFQGVVRRHHFRGGDATHGAKGWHRRPGAIGQRLFPGRVFRGMRMAGHMGDRKVTVQNLRVVQVREQDNALLIEGALPGATGGLLIIRHALKMAKPAGKAA